MVSASVVKRCGTSTGMCVEVAGEGGGGGGRFSTTAVVTAFVYRELRSRLSYHKMMYVHHVLHCCYLFLTHENWNNVFKTLISVFVCVRACLCMCCVLVSFVPALLDGCSGSATAGSVRHGLRGATAGGAADGFRTVSAHQEKP